MICLKHKNPDTPGEKKTTVSRPAFILIARIWNPLQHPRTIRAGTIETTPLR